MKKILTIARREYQAMVATKAFAIGMALMPVLMLGGMWIPGLLKGMERAEERRIAVVDGSGLLFEPLQLAAEQRNQLLQTEQEAAAAGKGAADEPPLSVDEGEERRTRRAMGLEEIHRYVLERIPAEEFEDEQRYELSERIRKGELYAFLEIPADVLQIDPAVALDQVLKSPLPVRYIAQDAALSDARRWAETALNQLIRAARLSQTVAADTLPQVLIELERRTPVESGGLYVRDSSGDVTSERKPDELASIFLPMGMMMLMFMIIMMSAQPMLESVLEEKTLRISEVLLGSANARQLMSGKLIGNVGGSLTVFLVYAAGGLAAAYWKGYADMIPFHVLPWFVVYQVLAVLLFSSVFMAIAASVSQLKEAQSLLLPVWMTMLIPLFVWFNVVREPNSLLATTLSFFPPSTPLMMTLRLATGAVIPVWQIAVSLLLLIGGTWVGVTAAARVYRIGILWQGKTPGTSEVLNWIFRGPAAVGRLQPVEMEHPQS